MNDLLCLTCWQATSPRDAPALCATCEKPERAPRRRRRFEGAFDDGSRRRRTGTHPCAEHPGARALRHCAEGHLLHDDARLKPGERHGVAVAGLPGSGKTYLLASMVETVAGITTSGPALRLIPLADTAERWEAGIATPYRRRHVLPRTPGLSAAAGTTRERGVRNFAWKAVVADGEDILESVRPVLTCDWPGEAFAGQGSDDGDFTRFLGLVDTILFVVDGAAMAAGRGATPHDALASEDQAGLELQPERELRALGVLRDRLGIERSRRTSLALVIAKADRLWDASEVTGLSREDCRAEPEAAHEAIRSALVRCGRGTLLADAGDHFRDVALFATSSFGFTPGPQDVDPSPAPGRFLRDLEPAGVARPLLWALRVADVEMPP